MVGSLFLVRFLWWMFYAERKEHDSNWRMAAQGDGLAYCCRNTHATEDGLTVVDYLGLQVTTLSQTKKQSPKKGMDSR